MKELIYRVLNFFSFQTSCFIALHKKLFDFLSESLISIQGSFGLVSWSQFQFQNPVHLRNNLFSLKGFHFPLPLVVFNRVLLYHLKFQWRLLEIIPIFQKLQQCSYSNVAIQIFLEYLF